MGGCMTLIEKHTPRKRRISCSMYYLSNSSSEEDEKKYSLLRRRCKNGGSPWYHEGENW